MKNKKIEQILKQTDLVHDWSHLNTKPHIVLAETLDEVKQTIFDYSKENVIPVYVPNLRTFGPVYPVQILLAGLVDSSKSEGYDKDRLYDPIESSVRALMHLDPAQKEALDHVHSRDSINTLEYINKRGLQEYQNIRRLPENFRQSIDFFLQKGEKKAVIAGIPFLTEQQEQFIEVNGLYHPRVVYIVTKDD